MSASNNQHRDDLCSFHSDFSQQVMGLLNGIRGDVRWMLKIGSFVIISIGAMVTLTFPMIKDLVSSVADLRQLIVLQMARIDSLEKNDDKLFAVKEKRDAQMVEILRKLDAKQ